MNANTRPELMAIQAHDDEITNTSNNPSLNDIIEARMSRRSMFKAGFGTAGTAVLGTIGLSACGGGNDNTPATPAPAATPAPTPEPVALNQTKLGFTPVAKNLNDVVTVPSTYTAKPIYALGDPLTASTPDYKNDGTDTDYENRAGDHHDGMEYFGLNAAGMARDVNGSDRALLVMNHEATSNTRPDIASVFLHADGGTNTLPRPASEVDKEIAIHGVSVVEVGKVNGQFAYQKGSSYNRRVTPMTPMQINGVARGNALLRTKFSATGNDSRGTVNNCGTGYTPWGTYLSGEENWNGYVARAAGDNAARGGITAKSVVSLNRYGVAMPADAASVPAGGPAVPQRRPSRHGWESVTDASAVDKYARWNISHTGTALDTDDYRNELNTFGYMVEIDPYDKNVAIRKRTTLGRFAHESGVFGPLVAGKPVVVYMGDDSQGEYIYKFVSTANWDAADYNPANRITTGDKYLDNGKLYVAKYDAAGTGRWIELNTAAIPTAYTTYAFADAADVAVNTRLAADAVGATRMDRPEWCAVNPANGEIYYTLTNNANRKVEPSSTQFGLDAANPRSYTDVNGTTTVSARNVNGHIVRMRETNSEAAATTFTWDVYLFGAQADASPTQVNLSSLSGDQDFSSPDGLWFSPKTGFVFIQTDDGAYTDVTNCMMLIGRPGQVGDGSTPTLSYTKLDGSTVTIQTRVGAKPTADTLRRFLVGPVDCEITGICETPDAKTIFVNIQHPGETLAKADIGTPSKYLSHWPANAGYGAGGATTARPRSATIVITKNDGGVVGS